MKYVYPLLCSLFLIGCGNNATSQTAGETAAPAPETTLSQNVAETAAPSESQSAPATPEQTPAQSVAAASPEPISATVDGAALFAQKCVSCHGQKAEKSALGKSQVITGWDASKIKDALHGYQAGTYGKEMKGVMQGQAKALNDDQINALAAHISSL